MTFRLGLTGSIGMGKSTTARMFADAGCAVWDADAAVHRAYAKGGAAVAPIAARVPQAVCDGAVDRAALRAHLQAEPADFAWLESIVHPIVARDRADFIAQASADIVVLDIPMLYETGGDAHMDAVACVTAPADSQCARVLARGTMDAAQLDQILAKQMPNAEKCARADYVIETDTLDHAAAQVRAILADIRGKQHA